MGIDEKRHERDVCKMKLEMLECINGAETRFGSMGTAYELRRFLDDIIESQLSHGREFDAICEE